MKRGHDLMRIGGLQKLTLLDFPEHTACTVFTVGCNFRCPFCHNTPLLGSLPDEETMTADAFFAFLKKRQGILDGVAITGGEPLLQPDLADFMEEVRALGFAVKLDTNGSFPDKLAELIDRGLVDYVAMDIKNAPEKLALTAGEAAARLAPQLDRSISLLMEGRVPYEFRTTTVAEFHTPEDFAAIGRRIAGAPRYFIQCFTDSGNILSDGLHAPDKATLKACLDAVKPYVPGAALRGV